MAHYPPNVGIVAIDVYFPRTYVSQTELEKFDNAGAGKYTTGLGQQNMAFVTDREDINSICLTVVTSLLEKYKIPLQSIGRLEVGTETLLDKSKSVKSVLMQLFQQSGNTNIEGVDTYNACYGGTNALFNALNWVESSAWDGRYALVVAGDIAVYAAGNARPTGGCGAVAMLVGPNAPIVAERGLRGSHMEHAYDFYKPRPDVEYPTVDGALSITCYYRALDNSYRHFKQAWARSNPSTRFDHTKFDFMVFHSPFNKLVQKSFGRLLYLDFLDNPDDKFYTDVQAFRNIPLDKSYADKELETAFLKKSKELYEAKVLTSTLLQRECGNAYCGSVYGGLAALLSEKSDELLSKRVTMFSYGSGLASSLFSLRIAGSVKHIAEHLNVRQRLAQRVAVPPPDFTRILDSREKRFGKCGYKAEAPVEGLYPGTFYLVEVDDKYRRSYQRAPGHYRKSSL